MLTDNNKCFACGRENRDGLQLVFTYSPDGRKVETTFVPGGKYQGWKGVVHGGIIVTLLDEVMAKAAAGQGVTVLTGEITAKFKNPARIREPLRCVAEIESVKRKVIYAHATAFREDGTVVARAASKMFVTRNENGS